MKKIQLITIATLISAVSLVSGCASTQKARVNFDKNEQVQTSQYQTFAWLNPDKIIGAPADINSVMKVRIDNAIEAAFIAKGYQLVESPDAADFAISYSIGNRDKVKVDSFPASFRTGFGWGRGYFGSLFLTTETHVRSYSEGKLAIDVFDVKTKQPAWHGWGLKRINNFNNDDPTAAVKTIVEQVVNQFN